MQPMTRRKFLVVVGGSTLASLPVFHLLPRGNVPAHRADSSDSARSSSDFQAVKRTSWALGSDVSMTVLHERRDVAERAISAALDELRRVDEIMSLYRPPSELCRLNREGTLDRPHPYLVEVLRKAQLVSEQSGGAFDVTVQPLWEIYAAAKQGRCPTPLVSATPTPRPPAAPPSAAKTPAPMPAHLTPTISVPQSALRNHQRLPPSHLSVSRAQTTGERAKKSRT